MGRSARTRGVFDRLNLADPKARKYLMEQTERHFFGGLTFAETAESLGVSDKTVQRDWLLARAWLRREMADASLLAGDEPGKA